MMKLRGTDFRVQRTSFAVSQRDFHRLKADDRLLWPHVVQYVRSRYAAVHEAK